MDKTQESYSKLRASGNEAKDTQALGNVEIRRSNATYLPWLAAALALGGASYLMATYRSASTSGASSAVTVTPESYAVCTEPGKVYTVDEARPNVDCILIQKDEIRVAGSIGTFVYMRTREVQAYNPHNASEELHAYWDGYQNELIKKFYGNEPKAKKALTVYHTKPGSIIVPGLAGV